MKKRFSPIIDNHSYPIIDKSYCAGSIANKDVLVLADQDYLQDIENQLIIEKADYYFFTNIDDLDSTIGGLIGDEVTIINALKYDYYSNVYEFLQKEIDYLIKKNMKTRLVVSVVYDDYTSDISIIQSLIKGLSIPLSRHNILFSGFVIKKEYSNLLAGLLCNYCGKYGLPFLSTCFSFDRRKK